MSIFRYPNSQNWWYEFRFAGQRVRESTKSPSRTLAREAERARRRELEESYNGIRRPKRLPFSEAAEEWLELKKLTLAPKSLRIEHDNLRHAFPHFSEKLVCHVDARDIARYQKARLSEGAAPKTINLEVGTLRAVLRRYDQWAYLRPDVKMLPIHEEYGYALNPLEEEALLKACLNSRSRSLYTAVTLALTTAMRIREIRLLKWMQIDLVGATATVGESKTPASTGRVIPLNSRILSVVREWASLFPSRQPEHYVFPCERYGAAGDAFTACTYHTNPLLPITSWKTAWRTAKRCAGFEGPQVVQSVRIRFHDLRHTACTRMLEGGVSFHVVAQIMGWSATSMIRMSRRYGHIGQGAQRQAVELLGRNLTRADSFEKSPEVSMRMGKRIQ